MKRFFLLLLVSLCLVGCGKQVDPAMTYYQNAVTDVSERTSFDTEFPFQIRVGVEPLDSQEFIYQVVVDQVSSKLTEVRAIAVADDPIDDTYPSVGIFDDPITLVPSKLTDSDKKGFYLVGYLSRKKDAADYTGRIKVYIEYRDEQGTLYKKYYCYQKETK